MMRTRILICSLGLLSLNLIFGKSVKASSSFDVSPTASCNINFQILDNSCTASSRYTYPVSAVPGTSLGTDVVLSEVRMVVEHSWDADLDIFLRSPSGVEVELTTDNGGGADNYGDPTDLNCQNYTTFTMSACVSIIDGVAPFIGAFLPEGNLYDFHDASDPNGDWVLQLCDDGGGDVGSLHFFELIFETNTCVQATALTLTTPGATEVGLSWDMGNDNCVNTYLEYGPPGFIPGMGASAGGGTLISLACPLSLPYTLSGLQELSTYDIYIRESCDVDVFSHNSCVLTLTTECSTPAVSLTEDFESQSLCGTSCGTVCPVSGTWHNRSDDDFDWLVDEGGTTSSNTGPSDDVSIGGKYLYIEGSGASCRSGNQAVLESNCIQVSAPSGTCHLSFYYHLFGNGIGRLEFQVKANANASWLPIWFVSGEQGDEWIRTFIDLSFYHGQIVQFRFVAIGGDNFRSDLALDQIQFYGSTDIGEGNFTFYVDMDNDGYGDPDNFINRCFPAIPSGFQTNSLDCDDSDANIHPNAMEVACNGIDENCNGNLDDAILPDPLVVDQSVCDGSEAILKPTGNPIGEWHWFDLPNGGQLLAVADSLTTLPLTEPATYYVQDSAVGCYSQRVAINVNINPLPDITTNDQPTICLGESFDLSSITVVDLNGVGGMFSYHNASPASQANHLATPIVSPTTNRTYAILLTSSDGCTDELSVRLNVLEAPEANIAPGDSIALCRNSKTILTATPSGTGLPPYAYQWSSGQSSTSIAVNAGAMPQSQIYQLTVTDSQGCQNIDSIQVTTLPSISSVAIDSIANVSFCDGNDGWVALNPLNGTSPYNYAWSGPESGSINGVNGAYQINQLRQGSYRITISENTPQSCQLILPLVVINGPSVIIDPNVGTMGVSCFDGSDGAIDLTITAGNPEFLWSNGDTTEDLTNIDAGLYAVTVSDGACSNTLSGIIVEQPDELSAFVLDISEALCQGSADGQIEVLANGGTSPYTYAWSDGITTTAQANNLSAGQYDLTLTDANGCSFMTELIEVGEAEALVISPSLINNTSCFESADGAINVEISGGHPPYIYLWSNGLTSRDISGLAANTYSLSITDANGCTENIQGIQIDEPALMEINLVQATDASCNGVSDGELDIQVVGGTPPFRYLWSNGEISEDLDNLQPSFYKATVTDAKGCRTISPEYQIEAPDLMTLSQTFIQEPACNGIDDGFIALQVEGGTTPLFYDWNTGGNNSMISNLGAGSYTVTIYDSQGCKLEPVPFELDILQPLEAQLDLKSDVSCFGAQNGGIFISLPGDPNSYTYAWSNGASSQDLIGLSPGNYWATITAADGCIAYSDTFVIAQPNPLEVAVIAIEAPTCNGLEDGSIDVQITGGTAPYTYSWSNGTAGEDLIAAATGEYILTVLDANGCPISSPSIDVPEPDRIDIQVSQIDPIGCDNDGEGKIELIVEGGTAPYSYSWSNGDSSEILNVDEAGTYGVQLTDENGCLAIKSNLIVPQLFDSLPVNLIDLQLITCAGESNGALIPEITGGQAPFQFNWSNGMTDSIQQGLGAGAYALTITDDNGCIGILDTVRLTSPEPIDYTIDQILSVDCNGEPGGEIQIQVTGGVAPYTYLWSNGAVSEDPQFLLAGNYTVVITDSLGCILESPQPILVSQPLPFLINEVEETEPTCFGDANGGLRLLVNGGTPSYHFRWITGDTTSFLQNIVAGNYSCTITDDKGCVLQSGEVSLGQPAELVVNMGETEVINAPYCLPNSGGVLLSIEGGESPYDYFWNNGARSKDLMNVGGGQYFCNIEDVNGCLLQTPDYEIEVTDSLRNTPVTTPDIDGQGNGTAAMIITGGQGPYQFLWDSGLMDSVVTNLSFGLHFVTITDTDGCSRTDSVEVEFVVKTSRVFDQAEIRLFPNPAKDQIMLDIQFSMPEVFAIELFAADGRELSVRQFSSPTKVYQKLIDLNDLPSGLYYVRLIAEDGRAENLPFLKMD